MIVFLRRMVFFALLLIVLSACEGEIPDQIARLSSTYFNCLNLDDQIQVELNTHLEPVPEIVHSTSPDGNYRIVSVARTLDYRFLYLEDVNSGHRTLLDDAIHDVLRVVWAPNSRVVNYDWEGTYRWRYRGIADTQTGEILLDGESFAGYGIEAFSFDGKYVMVSRFNPLEEYRITIHPTRNYSYENTIVEFDGRTQVAWSPVDHRVAFVTVSGVGAIDLDTNIIQQVLHQNGARSVSGFPNWSLDGRDLIVEYIYSSTIYELAFYSAENQSLELLTSFTSITLYRSVHLLRASFTPDGRYLIYFRKLNSEEPYFDMWRFDLDTLQHELLAENLTYQQLSNEQFVIVRKESNQWRLEIRDRAGFLLRSYSLPTNEQRWSWLCRRLNAPFDNVIDCQKGDDFILLDESGIAIWRTSLQDDDSPKMLGSGTSDDDRFIARIFCQGDRTWLEFIDLTTRHIYRIPERFNKTFPLGPSGLGYFDVYPAPDEQSWLVLVSEVLFRLYPATNTWELSEPSSLIDHIVWSPDGQRYAFVTKINYLASEGDLFVRQTDGSKQWSFGVFPTTMLEDITWTHCGDILAPLRDRIAAEALD